MCAPLIRSLSLPGQRRRLQLRIFCHTPLYLACGKAGQFWLNGASARDTVDLALYSLFCTWARRVGLGWPLGYIGLHLALQSDWTWPPSKSAVAYQYFKRPPFILYLNYVGAMAHQHDRQYCCASELFNKCVHRHCLTGCTG